MKDILLAQIPPFDKDDLKITSSKTSPSIINSVTNDEDDWFDQRKKSDYSIVNSVTTDEDDFEELQKNGKGLMQSVQQHPYKDQALISREEILPRRKKQTYATKSSDLGSSVLGYNREVVGFLNRYDRMMKEQEQEKSTTIAHLHFFFELLIDLQHDEQDTSKHQFDANVDTYLLKEFSFGELKEAKKKIKNSEKYSMIQTDKQFLMVLDILCNDEDNSEKLHGSKAEEQKITWAEIIQIYRNCVVGMQTLKMIGSHDPIRMRAKQRILAAHSIYKESPLFYHSPSMKEPPTECERIESGITYDGSLVNKVEVYQGSLPDARSRSVHHSLVVFFVAFIAVAIPTFFFLSNIQATTEYEDILLVRQTEALMQSSLRTKLNVTEIATDSFSSERHMSQTIISSQGPFPVERTKNEPSYFVQSQKHLIGIGSTVPTRTKVKTNRKKFLSPVNTSNKIDLDQNIKKFKDVSAKRQESFEINVAKVVGSTAVIIYFLSVSTVSVTTVLSWLPIGGGVMLATFVAQTIRLGISNVLRKLKWKMRKPSIISNKSRNSRIDRKA